MADVNQNQAGVLNYYRNVRSASVPQGSHSLPTTNLPITTPPRVPWETHNETNTEPTVGQPQANDKAGMNTDTSAGPGEEFRPVPPDHIVLGILTIVICCAWPCGIVSLSHAVQVQPEYRNGNYNAAEFNSSKAWRWGIAGIAFSCVVILITIIFLLVLMSLRISEQS